MSDFNITDEAVEDACVAYNVNAGLGYSVADRDCMRAALEAALPVMFEPIRIGHAGRLTLYRLKEPK